MRQDRKIYGDTGDGGVRLGGGATSSPDYCKEAVIFNAKQCWGFVTDTERLARPAPYPSR